MNVLHGHRRGLCRCSKIASNQAEGEVGAGDLWERIARNDQQVSVIERYRQYFQGDED
jgi:hypothetical protein